MNDESPLEKKKPKSTIVTRAYLLSITPVLLLMSSL